MPKYENTKMLKLIMLKNYSSNNIYIYYIIVLID